MKRFALYCLIAALAILSSFAGGCGLPSGKKLLKQQVAAVGGKEVIEKNKSAITKVQIDILPIGNTGAMTAYTDGTRTYTEGEIAGFGQIQEGSDGEVIWENSPISGPRIIEGSEKLAREAMLAFEKHDEIDKYVEKMETVGVEPVDGKLCHKLVCTMKNGVPTITIWFEQSTGLAVQMSSTLVTQGGELPTLTKLGDYRPVNGLKIPHMTSTSIAGIQEVQVRVLSVETGVKHDEHRFDPPAPVKQLLEYRKQQEEEKKKREEKPTGTAEGGATPK